MANLLTSSSRLRFSIPLGPPGPVCRKGIHLRLGEVVLSKPLLSLQTKGLALSWEIQRPAGPEDEGDGFPVILCYPVFLRKLGRFVFGHFRHLSKLGKQALPFTWDSPDALEKGVKGI